MTVEVLEGRSPLTPVTNRENRTTPRSLYASVAYPEASYDDPEAIVALRDEILGQNQADSRALASKQTGAASWAESERRRYRALLGASATEQRLLQRRVALGCAPLALVSGAWLQWATEPANAEEETALAVLTLYASDIGAGSPRASRGEAYRELLRRLRVADYVSPTSHVVRDTRISDVAFYLPAVLLAMSRRPNMFLPEILGADLCLRAVGLLPALSIVHDSEAVHSDWSALDPATDRLDGVAGGLEQCRAAIESLIRSSPGEVERRISAGFEWALMSLTRWSALLRTELVDAIDPAHEMADLLRRRAGEAAVYHQGFRLAGRPLSSWLEECGQSPYPLMDALAASRLIKPGRAEGSRLVTSLVSDRGPMFRVFSPQELDILRRWIDSLPPAGGGRRTRAREHDAAPGAGNAGVAVPVSAMSGPAGSRSDPVPESLRDAYHQLQTRASSPRLLVWAEAYVRGWLARSRLGVRASDDQLPEVWTSEGLRPWLLDQHARHARAFEADAGAALPSREALIESTLQLAPLTLIDGSWVGGFTDYEQASSDVGRFLFEIYWDELGNGQPSLNHPRIYRELLDEMGVQLPPTHSRAFAESRLLKEWSLELPVYWLSISKFPLTFVAEVLGLNVAMELAGVGGGYRRTRMALQHHGFSTSFVDIHNTIDNVGTGHSAWAADAVDAYMNALANAQGRKAQLAAWHRVRVGFASLTPPDGSLARLVQRGADRRARVATNRCSLARRRS